MTPPRDVGRDEEMKMGRPSRIKNAIGAILFVLVGLLYMTGMSDVPADHATDSGTTLEVGEVSTPITVVAIPDLRT